MRDLNPVLAVIAKLINYYLENHWFAVTIKIIIIFAVAFGIVWFLDVINFDPSVFFRDKSE